MILDLSAVINVDGKKMEFEKPLDFTDRNESGIVFLTPVLVKGKVSNIGGSLELSVALKTRLEFSCDRCCETFEEDFECTFCEVLKKDDERTEDDGNPDVIHFRGNSIRLDDVILNNIIVALPSKVLCSEECRGLCPVCGKNLNFGECECDSRPTDPRFDALDKFFK